MFQFLFGARRSGERSSLRGRLSSGGGLQRRADLHRNILVERVSRREDAAE